MLDPEMMAFSLTGSKKFDINVESPNILPWMTNLMFAELLALKDIAPFNYENLVSHILKNPIIWDKVYKSSNIIFTELPNRALIDFSLFLKDDLVMPKTTLIAMTKTPGE